jgi:LysR family transcriptional activator of nhaA
MNAFGQAGMGLFPAPSPIEGELRRQYGLCRVGELAAVRERFFAITVERKLKHPAVITISEAARRRLFG